MSTGELNMPVHAAAPVPSSPAQARKRVEILLYDEWGTERPEGACGIPVGDALLVTSELVTNAFRHGGGITDFDAELTDQGIRVSVGDRSDRLPRVPDRGAADALRPGGHGWRLVLALARNVAISRRARGGKLITALVSLA
jgi:hypothetical protein